MTADTTLQANGSCDRARGSLARRVAGARAARGFTLVELAIVVAIVGVLAVIAVVGYRKLTLSAKVTEARNMIAAIRIAQEDYKLERGIYADLGATPCPAGAGTDQKKWAWTPTCEGGGTLPNWTALPVHTDGPVQFGYATVAGTGTPPGNIGQPTNFVTVSSGVAAGPWYFITASADLDGDGTGGLYTELVGTSWAGNIFSTNEGQ
jgi:type IV pilus assembly protein PilA